MACVKGVKKFMFRFLLMEMSLGMLGTVWLATLRLEFWQGYVLYQQQQQQSVTQNLSVSLCLGFFIFYGGMVMHSPCHVLPSLRHLETRNNSKVCNLWEFAANYLNIMRNILLEIMTRLRY
uniref:Uncharacterized protein n=1 Tax=Glossina austeni TaxID=7395 RepID=A0A1A9VA47_GLOAU